MKKSNKKQEQYKNTFTFVCSLLIVALHLSLWGLTWMHFYARDILRPFGYKGNWLVIAVYGVVLILFTNFYGGYKVGYYQRDDVILSSILALIITNGITYLQTSLISRALLHISPFLVMTIIQIISIIIWSFFTSILYTKIFPAYNMLLIYGGDGLARSLIKKMMERSDKYKILKTINIGENISYQDMKIENYDAVILCDLPPKEKNQLLKYCFINSIKTYTTPKISDIIVRGAAEINLFDTPLILNENQGLSLVQKRIKRGLDLLIATIGLIITSPILIIVAVAIKIEDGGPVFFKQKRCTLDNRLFYVIKFRSMIQDAEKDGVPQPAVDNDDRITHVGRIIRATRLDEIPQLINIIKGEMSLVGPRPERIEHVEKYTAEIPEFTMRSKMKAGLTGYAQVYGRYNTSAYDKLKMDLMYITNYSIFEDFKILMMTVKIIFKKSSTEGFE